MKNICERLFLRFLLSCCSPTWTNNITNYIGSEDIFSKTKQKVHSKTQLDEKKTYLFMMFFITSFFSIFPLHLRWLLPYIIKNNSSQGLWSSATNQGLILDQCNGKVKLMTHLCCSFKTNYRSSHHRTYEKRCSEQFHEIHRKTPVPESFFNKIADLRPATLLKKKLWHSCFPVNFAKFLRTHFLQNTSGRLLL